MRFSAGHGVILALLVASVVVWLLVEGRHAGRHRSQATEMDRGSRLVLGLSFVAAIVLAMLARKVTWAAFPHDGVTAAIGLVLLWSGIGLRWWSIRTLGRYFTTAVMTSSDQPVITAGPYGFVRHPSYSGLVLAFAGLGVLEGNWLSLAATVLLPLAALINRIHVEEAALSTTLGDSYLSYAAVHKRLLPHVW